MTESTSRGGAVSRVLKFTSQDHGEAIQPLPAGARIVAVGDQSGALQLWAECDDNVSFEDRRFAVLMTGFDEVPARSAFIGTVLSAGRNIVRHVYEVLP